MVSKDLNVTTCIERIVTTVVWQSSMLVSKMNVVVHLASGARERRES